MTDFRNGFGLECVIQVGGIDDARAVFCKCVDRNWRAQEFVPRAVAEESYRDYPQDNVSPTTKALRVWGIQEKDEGGEVDKSAGFTTA